jgi:hypothetical protein
MINSFIWVTFQREGIHCYPAALTDPKLQSVSFLGYPHRHIFHFRVELEVFHDDRDVEFIMFKRELEQYIDGMMGFLNNKSCEMIANDLYNLYIKVKYPNRICVIEVSEDNENGCRIYFNEESE